MAVRIAAYGLAWRVQDNIGVVRLRGEDGKTWTSGPLQGAALAAFAAVLRKGASADRGVVFSSDEFTEKERATEGAVFKPLSGENPFPW